ncbi:MAG: heavy metal-responsive transcriptional regulator [Deltaproteobacteria bacterium]|nr:heavy metal-responsive transcriptional regulator [Deltaproteobacteria bacterium]
MGEEFTIGVLAKRVGVDVQTVLYYERRGLLLPAGRKEMGYRLYNKESIKRLGFIRHGKELGFTLAEIKSLLDLRVESASACEKVQKKVNDKLTMVEQKIRGLKSLRKVLNELVECCDRRQPTEECPILKAIEIEEER